MARIFAPSPPRRLLVAVLCAILLTEGFHLLPHVQLPAMGAWAGALVETGALMLAIVPLCWLLIARIERRHRAIEKELREGEARFRALFDDAPVGFHELDTAGRIVRVNRTELQLLGYAEAEMLGRPASQFAVASTLSEEMVRAKLAGRIPVGESFPREFRRKDGSKLAVVLCDRLIRDDQGKIIGLRSSLQDDTARREAEDRAKSLAQAVEQSPVTIVITDPSGKIEYVNPKFTALTGYTREDALGQNPRVLKSGQMPKEAYAELWTAITAGRVWSGELLNRKKTGELFWEQATISAIRDTAGKTTHFVAVKEDITGRKELELNLARSRDEADVLNRQLQAAIGRAEAFGREAVEATRAKSEFLANMSHEIRTPLNAVIGMSGLLLDTELREDQREFAQTIGTCGDSLLGLINDILDYSKIESGHLELERAPFEVRECLESSLDVLAARASEKKLDLLYWIDVDAPVALVGDLTRLRQVLVNLVSNAVKFTAKGEVFVNVSVCNYLPDGTVRLAFAVSDCGIGIPPDRLDRLFKTFSQVDASTTRHFGGTGLGLAICKRLVELMGGRIWVESVPGQGSTFAFELTFPVAPVAPRSFQSECPPEINGRRMLVVDDNATNRRILCLQAGSWGLRPRAVGSAAEALACIAQGDPFDVAVLDLQMPGMDGHQLAAEIRRHRTVAELPIVILTSHGHSAPPAALEIAASLVKPVKPQVLFDRLVEIFHGRRLRRLPLRAAGNGGENLAENHPLAILVAEDNPVNQRVARLMLQRLGYRSDTAANGLEVLAAVERQSYDLIFMDMEMPEMDGLEATREICRRWNSNERPRIVAMTANASSADRVECLASGMDEFITKPVRPAELRTALLATEARGVAMA